MVATGNQSSRLTEHVAAAVLGILERESERIRAAVHSRAVQALGDQGRFLREKFGRSELDL